MNATIHFTVSGRPAGAALLERVIRNTISLGLGVTRKERAAWANEEYARLAKQAFARGGAAEVGALNARLADEDRFLCEKSRQLDAPLSPPQRRRRVSLKPTR